MQVLPDNQILHFEKSYQRCDDSDQDISYSLQVGTRECTLTLEQAMSKIANEFEQIAKLVPPGSAIVVSCKAFRPWTEEEAEKRRR